MQAVLHTPGAPDRGRAARRRERGGTDVEAPLTGAAVTRLDLRLDHGHGCDLGKAALARTLAFARHPVDLVRDGAAARLDAAVILSTSATASISSGRAVAKKS